MILGFCQLKVSNNYYNVEIGVKCSMHDLISHFNYCESCLCDVGHIMQMM